MVAFPKILPPPLLPRTWCAGVIPLLAEMVGTAYRMAACTCVCAPEAGLALTATSPRSPVRWQLSSKVRPPLLLCFGTDCPTRVGFLAIQGGTALGYPGGER